MAVGIEINQTLKLHAMLSETLIIFINAILAINAPEQTIAPVEKTSAVKTEQTTTPTTPPITERRRGGWDGN